ncbi:hypothetical protein DPMN_172914 [Dreissena polymorpha]|uniref:Uncharacterized protein n=1 Tax=Dreissena polymorpha TaxID=45954 RepID=A0A9D4IFL2_DREPO|nr:hypothetical protein DPMN_172914 [Dreissena polymorpha]
MPERHTGKNIAIRLKDCVDEFGLKGCVVACVHDNARNMDMAGRLCPGMAGPPLFCAHPSVVREAGHGASISGRCDVEGT